jgi:hypothetical protein
LLLYKNASQSNLGWRRWPKGIEEPIKNLIKGPKHGTHEFDDPIINLENPSEQLQ